MDFSRSANPEAIEDLLIHYENFAISVCHHFDGVVRSIAGDSCLLTFRQPDAGVAAANEFATRWRDYIEERALETHVAFGVALGNYWVFRSFVSGSGINIAAGLCDLAKSMPDIATKVILNDRLVARLGDNWDYTKIDPGEYFLAHRVPVRRPDPTPRVSKSARSR